MAHIRLTTLLSMLMLREEWGSATEPNLRSRCEQWMMQHEWTSSHDAHSEENYETFQRCLDHLRSGTPPQEDGAQQQLLAAGIHHPVLLSMHRGTLPPFSLGSLEHFERCRQAAQLPTGVDPEECCSGARICWSPEEMDECCRALHNRAGDDPPLAFLTSALDVHLGSRLRAQKSFNVQESWALQSLVQEGSWVVDAGANVGAYAIPLAHRVGRTGRVYAFEPFRLLFQLLTANVALNGLANVFTYQVALGSSPSTVQARGPDLTTYNLMSSFQVEGQGYSEQARGWTMKHSDEVEHVQVLPLDAYAADFPRLDLLKIDVEDMEEVVVLGALQLLARYRPHVWVENAKLFEHGDRSFVQRMEGLGYACHRPEGMDWELLCDFHA